MNKRHAFTLVEMLVVIAIIAIVAAMVAGMAHTAKIKQRAAQVEGDKQKLILMIDNYQSKLNFYPPDNALLTNVSAANQANYDAWASINPLLYELTGATNYPATSTIQFFDGTTNKSQNYSTAYGRLAVANASTEEPHVFFKPGPQPQEYAKYDATAGLGGLSKTGLSGLVVPVAGSAPVNGVVPLNFWRYDASSSIRHNPASYDLWAEYYVGDKSGVPIVITNGNW